MRKVLLSLLCLLTLTGTAHAAHSVHTAHQSYRHHYDDGRPSQWCGWFMRQRHGGDTSYNLARNWAHRGVESLPQVGTIVVWPHHVGEITGYDTARHQWIILSGNDGHQVRDRPRSIAGAIAFRRV